MTTVMIDNNSLTGRRLLKEIKKHPRVAKVVDNDTNKLLSSPNLLRQFKKTFDEECQHALTPEEFMLEMEQRIMKW
jgi:hypothetical protein